MVRRVDLVTGSLLTSGLTIATVDGRRDAATVSATHDGTLVEWLVEDGDPVSPGQPLLRMQPAAVSL
jgi:[acyl-carrier-protein] S-malonyltransferase